MSTGGQQHGGVAAVAAQSRATFATQLQNSLREQGTTLGGKRGARLLREEYEDLARYALEK